MPPGCEHLCHLLCLPDSSLKLPAFLPPPAAHRAVPAEAIRGDEPLGTSLHHGGGPGAVATGPRPLGTAALCQCPKRGSRCTKKLAAAFWSRRRRCQALGHANAVQERGTEQPRGGGVPCVPVPPSLITPSPCACLQGFIGDSAAACRGSLSQGWLPPAWHGASLVYG